MPATLGASAYVDVPALLRAPLNLETASLLGLNTATGGGTQAAGTTALVVAASAGFAVGPAWILDGPISEVVQITGSADGTHVTLGAPGTAFAHAAGVSVSQGGAGGSLAEVLLRASGYCEGFCQQGTAGGDRSLFAVARTERWAMPSTRAYVDRDAVIAVVPGHFPVQSVSALTVEFGQGQVVSFDVSQLELESAARLVEVPYLLASPSVGQQLFLDTRGISRSRRQWAVLTYLGGFTPGAVPYDFQQAVLWVAADLLSQRQNPTGASQFALGKRVVMQRQRGDVSGDSILLLRAHDALQPFVAEVWA